jgi:hypothetical protein
MGIRDEYTPQESSESYAPADTSTAAPEPARAAQAAKPSGAVGTAATAIGDVSSLMQRFGLTGKQASTAPGGGDTGSLGDVTAAQPLSASNIAGTMAGAGDMSSEAQDLGLTPAQTATATGNSQPAADAAAAGGVTARQPLAQQNIAGTMSSAVGDASSLAKQWGILPGGSSSGTAAGANPSLGSGVLSQGLGYAAAGLTAYQGTEGVLSAFHEGGVKGALDGTMSGAAAGAAIGSIIPGLGTVIGGVVGAAAGLATNLIGDAMGESGKFAARTYYKGTLFPQLEAVKNNFNGTGGDYLTAYSEANRDAASGMSYMTMKWGADAAGWVNANYLQKELNDVRTQIENEAKGNLQYSGRTAAQFHQGGVISNFGDLGTSSNEGYIHGMLGEGVVNVPAMQMHGAAVPMMNSGASASDMAAHYLAAAGAGSRGSGAGSVVHQHSWNVQALDAKSFGKFLDGGGIQQVIQSTNRHVGNYGGDGIAG